MELFFGLNRTVLDYASGSKITKFLFYLSRIQKIAPPYLQAGAIFWI